jgi:hypothetical protein
VCRQVSVGRIYSQRNYQDGQGTQGTSVAKCQQEATKRVCLFPTLGQQSRADRLNDQRCHDGKRPGHGATVEGRPSRAIYIVHRESEA